MKSILFRFCEKIKPDPNNCWNWLGSKREDYGLFRKNNMCFSAHRLSYEFNKGKIPKGLQLDHLCRNHSCVNPEHLEAVTPKENTNRGLTGKINHHNTRKTHCIYGHNLTANSVINGRCARICLICRKRNNDIWNEKMRKSN